MSPSRRALLLLAPPPAPPPPPPPPMAAQQYAATALIQRLWSSSPMSGKGRGSIADADAPSPSRNELGEPASSWWLEPAPPLPDAPPLPGAVQGAARRRGVSGSWAGGDEGGAGLAGLTTSPRRFDRAMTTSAPRGLSTKVALGPALGSDLPMLPALSLGPGQPWGAARQGSRFASSGQVYAYVAEASRPGSAPGSPRAGPGPRDVDDTEARALAAATAAAQRVKGRAQPKRCLVGEPGRRPHPEPVFLEGSMQLLRVQDSWLQPVFLADGQVRMPREYRSLLEDSAASASGWCGGAEAAAADDVFLTKTALEVGREERERAAPAAAAEAGCNADVRGAQAEVVAKAACNVREFDPSSVLPALVGLSHGQRAGGDEERQRLGDAGARAGLRSFGSCDAGWD
ncbi:hypothetical protein FOA52_013995 [Chlamydomonas sp. UWO 241]|nr:hypothetical protein FOA52_013995 [Chlamydomonas sp. UWO 241]